MDKLMEAMKRLFATNYQYYVKAHGFHVNVVGPDFAQYHALFSEVYEFADDATDTIGEHIRALQGIAPFSLKRIMELGRIKDSAERPEAMKMIEMAQRKKQEVKDIPQKSQEEIQKTNLNDSSQNNDAGLVKQKQGASLSVQETEKQSQVFLSPKEEETFKQKIAQKMPGMYSPFNPPSVQQVSRDVEKHFPEDWARAKPEFKAELERIAREQFKLRDEENAAKAAAAAKQQDRKSTRLNSSH